MSLHERSWFFLGAALAAAALATAAACGGSDHPAAAGDGIVFTPPVAPPGTSSGTLPVDAAIDSGDPPVGPGLCEDVVQLSQDVAEYTIALPQPAVAGGAIPPGTYVLSELYDYEDPGSGGADPPPPKPTGALARITLYVGHATIQVVEERGAEDPDGGAFASTQIRGGTYAIAGNVLTTTDVCPGKDSRDVPFGVVGKLLTLNVSPHKSETYLLKEF